MYVVNQHFLLHSIYFRAQQEQQRFIWHGTKYDEIVSVFTPEYVRPIRVSPLAALAVRVPGTVVLV